MSRIRFQAKENGRAMLRGNWLRAMFIVLIIGLLFFGLTQLDNGYRYAFNIPLQDKNGFYNVSTVSLIITGIFALLTLLFIPPLMTGQTEWYWNLSGHSETSVGDIFAWFGSLKLYLKSLRLSLLILLKLVLWGLLPCGVPITVLYFAYYFYPGDNNLGSPYLVLSYFLLVIGIILLTGGLLLLGFLATRYFLARYLIVENSEMKVMESVALSVRYSKTYRTEIFVFYLSFLLWFVSCYFLIPLFYVIPYFKSSAAIFAKHIIFTQRADEKNRAGAQS